MKQLHKSPTHAPSPAHAPASKISKPARPGPRTWVGYLLREQRLLFVLLGALIATSFFLLRPYLFSLSASNPTERSPIFNFAAHSSDPRGVPAGFRPPPRRVVVTGGAGGDSVIVVDNFFTGRKENVAHHLRNPRFELLRHDVVEPILLEHKTNVMGTLNMLGLAKRIGARFLLTSTSEVYGDPLEHPQKETYWGHVNPIGTVLLVYTTSLCSLLSTSYYLQRIKPLRFSGVRSCYDEGKRTAETLTMDYHRGGGVAVRIARIFNTYGPRMCLDDGRVVSNFVAQALRKHPMTVYGDGKQTRSFQYVSDLVAGLMALMESEHIGPFNLGNPGEFTMLELAEVVKETIDPMSTIEFKPNTADDPHMRKPDITKAKQLLGWEPKLSLVPSVCVELSMYKFHLLKTLNLLAEKLIAEWYIRCSDNSETGGAVVPSRPSDHRDMTLLLAITVDSEEPDAILRASAGEQGLHCHHTAAVIIQAGDKNALQLPSQGQPKLSLAVELLIDDGHRAGAERPRPRQGAQPAAGVADRALAGEGRVFRGRGAAGIWWRASVGVERYGLAGAVGSGRGAVACRAAARRGVYRD
uniref:UDP-glucuronate decarboxylase n=1 Tax=Aegilops tauschii TaxID=37682 RepID=M8AYH3_AEGTA